MTRRAALTLILCLRARRLLCHDTRRLLAQAVWRTRTDITAWLPAVDRWAAVVAERRRQRTFLEGTIVIADATKNKRPTRRRR